MNKKFIDDIPPVFKGVLSLAAAGAAMFGAYKLYNYLKEQQANKDKSAEVDAASDEAKKLIKSGVKASLNEVQIKNMVNGIKEAFLNYDLITRSHVQPLYKELVKVKNDLDMLNLINSYGIQTIDFPYSKFTVNDYTGNLTESVKHFLNNSEVNAANGILARRKIKYRF